jgi:hypothetical protein
MILSIEGGEIFERNLRRLVAQIRDAVCAGCACAGRVCRGRELWVYVIEMLRRLQRVLGPNNDDRLKYKFSH